MFSQKASLGHFKTTVQLAKPYTYLLNLENIFNGLTETHAKIKVINFH